ncbi:hypothetical protein [Cellvibrio fibrivorans]|uniref:Uncharacterized protein n=1 Tax=Cellvibrio fibrivorans TaxID=126350 RepID=A0ABU1V3R5_9GAMM|nr:hypothetical protein [Cellvibrio fibrivorans]MDR7092109.1 hypothetical protein [Cellvibrio fibrivorans]
MKEYIRLIERLHPDSDVLSINEKYKILAGVLAETKRLRITVGIFAFITGAVIAGLAFTVLKVSLQEPLVYIVKGSIASALAFLSYFVSQRIILEKHLMKRYTKF